MEITPKELYKKMQDPDFRKKSIVVDVRVPGEHRAERIPSTLNIPLDKLKTFKKELEGYENVYFHCETGGRSENACSLLEQERLYSWVNIDGGLEGWKSENLPVIKGRGISMQRQVMISAGFIVLVGSILAMFKIGFIAVTLFVSLGLIFAGITNNCQMAKILRRMPWNK